MRKHYMSLQWVLENKCALGFQGQTIAVASQAVLDEPLRLRNTIRIPPRSTVMALGYYNQMFNGKATAMSCTELKMSMIQHGPRLQERRTLAHQGTFLIDYRRVTHQKTI